MIVLFGPAGSGKSSQGRRLAEKYGMEWLSVGQVIRDTGRFNEVTDRGELVETGVVMGLMRERILAAKARGQEVVLDGYPRDIEQAEILVKEGTIKEIKLAVVIEVPEEELLRRLMKRGRKDDVTEVILRRFEVFKENMGGILRLLSEEGVRVVRILGTGTMEEVTERISQAMEAGGVVAGRGDFLEQDEKSR